MKKTLPGLLWMSIGALSLVFVMHLFMGLAGGNLALLVSAALEVVLVVGLLYGQKWAYILIMVFAVLGAVAGFAKGIDSGFGILIANAIIVGPMVMCTKFFFPESANP